MQRWFSLMRIKDVACDGSDGAWFWLGFSCGSVMHRVLRWRTGWLSDGETSAATSRVCQLWFHDAPSHPLAHGLALRWRDIGCEDGRLGTDVKRSCGADKRTSYVRYKRTAGAFALQTRTRELSYTLWTHRRIG